MEVMKNSILEAERQEGRIEGREECRAELIRKMLAEACSLEFVSRISGIAVEDLSCF